MIDYIGKLEVIAKARENHADLLEDMGSLRPWLFVHYRRLWMEGARNEAKLLRECRKAALRAAEEIEKLKRALSVEATRVVTLTNTLNEIERNEIEGTELAAQQGAAQRCGLQSLDRRAV